MHGECRQLRGYVSSGTFEKQEGEKQRARQSLCAPSIDIKLMLLQSIPLLLSM